MYIPGETPLKPNKALCHYTKCCSPETANLEGPKSKNTTLEKIIKLIFRRYLFTCSEDLFVKMKTPQNTTSATLCNKVTHLCKTSAVTQCNRTLLKKRDRGKKLLTMHTTCNNSHHESHPQRRQAKLMLAFREDPSSWHTQAQSNSTQ